MTVFLLILQMGPNVYDSYLKHISPVLEYVLCKMQNLHLNCLKILLRIHQPDENHTASQWVTIPTITVDNYKVPIDLVVEEISALS